MILKILCHFQWDEIYFKTGTRNFGVILTQCPSIQWSSKRKNQKKDQKSFGLLLKCSSKTANNSLQRICQQFSDTQQSLFAKLSMSFLGSNPIASFNELSEMF